MRLDRRADRVVQRIVFSGASASGTDPKGNLVAVYRPCMGNTSRPISHDFLLLAHEHADAVFDTDHEHEAACRRAVVRVREFLGALPVSPAALAQAVADLLPTTPTSNVANSKRRERARSLVGDGPVPLDARVDQWSGLVPHRVFLDLVQRGLVSGKRQGQAILVRWGDLLRACDGLPDARSMNDDGRARDDIRRAIGLLPKGGA